jgi:hypothetical protein
MRRFALEIKSFRGQKALAFWFLKQVKNTHQPAARRKAKAWRL